MAIIKIQLVKFITKCLQYHHLKIINKWILKTILNLFAIILFWKLIRVRMLHPRPILFNKVILVKMEIIWWTKWITKLTIKIKNWETAALQKWEIICKIQWWEITCKWLWWVMIIPKWWWIVIICKILCLWVIINLKWWIWITIKWWVIVICRILWWIIICKIQC